jgi:hypothetical protein
MAKAKRADNSLLHRVDLIERALHEAVQTAIMRHKKLGNPIAVWRQGRVVWLQPDEIEVASIPKSSDREHENP